MIVAQLQERREHGGETSFVHGPTILTTRTIGNRACDRRGLSVL